MRNRPTLTSVDTHKVMAACKAEAQKNKWNVAVAIVDDGGALLHFERLDGAAASSGVVAQGKATAAAALRVPTKLLVLQNKVRVSQSFLSAC